MCCNTGECYASQKHRCKCDCTRCRHCDRCGDKGNAKIGLLVAGAVGMYMFVASLPGCVQIFGKWGQSLQRAEIALKYTKEVMVDNGRVPRLKIPLKYPKMIICWRKRCPEPPPRRHSCSLSIFWMFQY